MTMPALLYAAVLVFFLGFELFGLPLVLGDPEGHLVLVHLPVQAHQQARHAVVPPDGGGRRVHHRGHLSAGAPAALAAQDRRQVRFGQGQGDAAEAAAARRLEVGRAGDRRVLARRSRSSCRSPGIALRAFVEQWGEGIKLAEVLTLDNFRQVFDQSDQVRAIVNTFLIGTLGGALAVACYTAIGLAGHRQRGGVAKVTRLPRADPARRAGVARGPRVPVDLSVRAGAEGAAQHDLLRVARVHRRLARLRAAARSRRAPADRPRARGESARTVGASRRAC